MTDNTGKCNMERDIEKTLVDAVKRAGGLVRKLQWIGRVGAPDRFVAIGGRVALVELKDTGKTLRPTQVAEHQRLKDAGVEVWTVDSKEQAEWLIKSMRPAKVGDLVRHVDLGALCTGRVVHAGVDCMDVEFGDPINRTLTVRTANIVVQPTGHVTKGRI